MDISDENFLTMEKIRKYSTDEVGLNEPELRKKTLSIVMDRISNIGKYIILLIHFLYKFFHVISRGSRFERIWSEK